MRLVKARVQNYRSVLDSGLFDIEEAKSIFVGPNEAGKTALLQAIQQLNPPSEVRQLDPLRDYPRSLYNDISTKKVVPKNVKVVTGYFKLEQGDIDALPAGFENSTYVFMRHLDNSSHHRIENGPSKPTLGDIRKELLRLTSHVDKNHGQDSASDTEKPSLQLEAFTAGLADGAEILSGLAADLISWLDGIFPLIEEGNDKEEERFDRLRRAATTSAKIDDALKVLRSSLPTFVLFNNYFRVKPRIHLDHLATRLEQGLLDDDLFDFGNQCLLKLLGFSARELSDLGKTAVPPANDPAALQEYQDQLDNRSYQLNAASVRLTKQISNTWQSNPNRAEAARLNVTADGQYLKVVVEDEIGVEIELDQRSEGFQWLVSFFVVFFAETSDKYENAILLLDEPGLSLHGLKQRVFRETLSKLAESNQTIYSTHSPFLVGPDELDLVRVVEMTDRSVGTKVHTSVSSSDSAAMLPLQEALGYDLAQSLFTQQRNLVLEGLTDYWYIVAIAMMLRESGAANLNEKIALVPAGNAGKIVYFATILHANSLKVVALLDSDAAGDQAAKQDTLVHTLGAKNILRTKDYCNGDVTTPEIEDLLRETLIEVANSELGHAISPAAKKQKARPIVDIFASEIDGFSKYKLAKAFLMWARTKDASDLTGAEVNQWVSLIERINKQLK